MPLGHLTNVLFVLVVFQAETLTRRIWVPQGGGKGDCAQPEPKEP